MRELFRLTIVLTIICCGAALSLAYVYNLTKEPIAYQQRLKKIRAINAVFPEYEDAPGLQMVDIPYCKDEEAGELCRQFYLVKNNDLPLGTAFEVSASGYGGKIDIMIGIVSESTISGIKIINHSETPGLGANITKQDFYKNFTGKTLINTNWSLKKNDGDVDQVSGATISSTAVMEAVHDGLIFFSEHKDKILTDHLDS
jgi:electron transport complex protein RnfG